jgi:hypothetical protein
MNLMTNLIKTIFKILRFLFQATIIPVLIFLIGLLFSHIMRAYDDPLIKAVRAKDINQVESLLKHGANVNVSENTFLRDSLNPIHIASEFGPIENVKLLLDHGADVNTKTVHNVTPLHFAAQGKNIFIANLLIERGARVDAEDYDGRTPLDWIAGKKWASSEMIDFLELREDVLIIRQKVHSKDEYDRFLDLAEKDKEFRQLKNITRLRSDQEFKDYIDQLKKCGQ